MNQTYTKSQKIRLLFYILIPILITQISMYAMTFLM